MKKMNKKGFTLIELLAIIVILAIIAVITVPIILNIIENAREGARKNSVIGYGKAVELAYTEALYEQHLNNATPAGDLSFTVKESESATNGTTLMLTVNYEGDTVSCNTREFVASKLKLSGCTVSGSTASYSYEDGKATLES